MSEETYTCDSFEARLHRLLDERALPEDDAQLREQAVTSAENRQLLAGQQLLIDGVDLLDMPELPADFAERCVAMAMAQPAIPLAKYDETRQGFSGRFIAMIAACAALVLISVVAFSMLRGPESPPVAVDDLPPSTTPITIPDQPEPPPIEVAVDVPAPSPEVQPETPKDATQKQYDDIYAAIRELRQKIPATNGEEDLLAMRPQWVDDMATGLRPVADSVGGAINVLRRNFPPSPRDDAEGKPQARTLDQLESRYVA